MAKGGLFGGRVGGSTPPFNPAAGGGGGTPPIFGRGQGGILPERGSQQQLDLVSMLVQSGMGAAQNSGNPLISLLAPLAGGAALSRSQGLYDKRQGDMKAQKSAETRAKLEGLLGNDPRTSQILDIMGDDGAPDYAQSIASKLLKGVPGVSAGGGRGGGGRGGGGGLPGGNDPSVMRDALLADGDLSPEQVDGLIETMSSPNSTADQRRMAREILQERLGGGEGGVDSDLEDLLAEPEPEPKDDGLNWFQRLFGGGEGEGTPATPAAPAKPPVTPLAQPGAANPAQGPQSTPQLPNDPVGPQARGPEKGAVEDGFEFQGGDPGDPKNWKKVS